MAEKECKCGHSHSHVQSQANHSHAAHSQGHSHKGQGETGKWTPSLELWENNAEMKRVNLERANYIEKVFAGEKTDVASRSFLDYGSGMGLFLHDMISTRKVFSSGVAADVEPVMLDYMQTKFAKEDPNFLKVTQSFLLTHTDGSDILKFTKPGSLFDLVAATFVLGHVKQDDIPKVIRNMCSVVKPGGYILIQEFDDIVKQNKAHDMSKSENKFVSEGGHAHTSVTRKMMKELFESCDMQVSNDLGYDTRMEVPTKEVYDAFMIFGRKPLPK